MRIHVKKTDNLVIPSAATPQSSGYDVEALYDAEVVGETVKDADGKVVGWKRIDYIQYKTGLTIAPQVDAYGNNYHTLAFPRSSVSKYNLVLANCIGLIDNDYRGEILLRFKYIWQPEDFLIIFKTVPQHDGTVAEVSQSPIGLLGRINPEKIYHKGDKICQLVSEITNHVEWYAAADLTATVRGSGGFGHTTAGSPAKRVEAPKEAANLADKWAAEMAGGRPQNYETLVKERERTTQK